MLKTKKTEDTVNVKSKKKNKIKFISIVAVLIIIACIAAARISYIYNYSKHYSNLIFPGVKVGEVNLSGKTKEQAKKIIEDKYVKSSNHKKIQIKDEDKVYSMDLSKINLKYDLNKAIEKAYSYGKDKNMFTKYGLISKAEPKEFDLKFSYDEKAIQSFISEIENSINKKAKNASLNIVGIETIRIVSGENGRKLQKDKLKEKIIKKLNSIFNGELVIEAPVEETKPRIVKEDLKSINKKIASYNTEFASRSTSERANNIILATKSINGTVLMPGDEFSFNDVVGERTAERGYESAHVIVGNKVEDGLGGGICQVSSTLYNTILKTNLKSTERVHHTLPSSYVPLGQDATIDYGNIDYKFKNTLKYPIFISAYTDNSDIYFDIYSNSEVTNETYEITNEVYATLEPKSKSVNDSNLEEGKKEIVQNPCTGFKVRVYKNIYRNGKFVKKELVTNDFYRPVDEVVKVGTKKVVVPKVEPSKPDATKPQVTKPEENKHNANKPEQPKTEIPKQ